MHRRGIGIGAVKAQKKRDHDLRGVGNELDETRVEHVAPLMAKFKASLEEFVTKHGDEIRKNSEFRADFHRMCANAGVDPLTSRKGFWTKVLGFGDFYYGTFHTYETRCMLDVLIPA
jgi:ESCRT-II complex subunit VPS22